MESERPAAWQIYLISAPPSFRIERYVPSSIHAADSCGAEEIFEVLDYFCRGNSTDHVPKQRERTRSLYILLILLISR